MQQCDFPEKPSNGRLTTVLMAYYQGTQDMLNLALSSFARHSAGEDYEIWLLVNGEEPKSIEEATQSAEKFNVQVKVLDVGIAPSSSGKHARLLDRAVVSVKTEHLLTCDSDCFPVADGWLAGLHGMLKEADVAGIAWPWIPPPADLNPKTIEWRIRQNHNWNKTQVACQLISVKYLFENNLFFADRDGDDNNFGLMNKVVLVGGRVAGLKPTACPFPDLVEFDPETNRQVSLVYGDSIYHHGGATREKVGEHFVDDKLFGTARKRIMAEGAEWLVKEGYRYKLDREDEVAQYKMQSLYSDAIRFLERNVSLFGGGWV